MTLPYDTFVFTHRALEGRIVRLGYRLQGGGEAVSFEETFELPSGFETSEGSPADVAAALQGMHLVLGTSYWKTCCPPRIEIEGPGLSAADAAFWTEVYNSGLGEFYYRNGLSPAGLARFPGEGDGPVTAGEPAQGPAIVLAGGGKDSVVAYEIVRESGREAVPMTMIPAGRDWRLAPDLEGLGLRVFRRLDPKLLELNQAGAYNGHVPFSAILAFTSQLVAVVGGFGNVVAANERSASYGNVVVDGVEVNHQWSKSLRFEGMFQEWQRRHLSRVPVYFSLLRPLSELRIAKAFASYPRWFGAVTSCNTNFRLQGGVGRRWCGHCAKCVFAAILLTPWLDDAALADVFGVNPLADPENLSWVRQLLGEGDHKPWDCVGTPDEVAAALWLASRRHADSDLPALRWFAGEVAPRLADPDELVRRELAVSPLHRIPPDWADVLHRYLEAH
jgi:UDP-N-acetyl-alpha-D-muramoyl-L-alanyl-L-glutamate epimerase